MMADGDLEAFVLTFERVAPLLTVEVQKTYFVLPGEEADDYTYLKEEILASTTVRIKESSERQTLESQVWGGKCSFIFFFNM